MGMANEQGLFGCVRGVFESSGIIGILASGHRVIATGRKRPPTLGFPGISQVRLRCAAAIAAVVFSLAGHPNTARAQTATELLPADGEPADWFGYSAGISGDVAVIGARMADDNGSGSGSAYVWRFNDTTGRWEEKQKLIPSNNMPGDYLGSAVAVEGDVAVVGAPGHDTPADLGTGGAWVFRFNDNDSRWIEEQELLASASESGDSFGDAIAFSGDTIVIGAYGDDDGPFGFNAGSAYVFRYNSEGLPGMRWIEEAKLVASDVAAGDNFGKSVGVFGNTIVVGAYYDDDRGTSSGSAYIFQRNDNGTPTNSGDDFWEETQKLVPSDGAEYDKFGQAVAVDGDTIVVGADQDDDTGPNFGSAYVFRYNSEGLPGMRWVEEAELYGSDSSKNCGFGVSVDVSGDVVAVGAFHDDGAYIDAGAVYTFAFDGSTWGEVTKHLNPTSGIWGNSFGYSVDISNGRAVIGAYYGLYSGSAYVVDISGGCVSGADCDDGDPCTTDFCSDGDCGHGDAGCECLDNLDCDDGNACTDDSCLNGDCRYTNNSTSCSDGDACTQNDRCSGGICSGTARNCDDGNICTTDVCSNGDCQSTNNTSSCDDGNACTERDRCWNGSCSGAQIDCDDDNACTDDFCSNGDCGHTNNTDFCSDGDACTTDDRCSGGICSGTDMNCDDHNICTTDVCSNGDCDYTNNTSSCDDGNACTERDRCWNGSCSGAQIDCDDGNPCTDDFCSNGSCRNTNNTDLCTDGNACTTDDRCSGGSCAGVLRDCSDDNLCTTDSCDPASGCVFDPISCPAGAVCVEGLCEPDGCASNSSCDDLSACTALLGTQDCEATLPRIANNVIRLEFGGTIEAPLPGEIEIRALLPGGGLGVVDLSAWFTPTIEGGNVLLLTEDGSVLSNETWYTIVNTGAWSCVAPFKRDYVVVFGDANGDAYSNANDINEIWANRADGVPRESRFDINGDGRVNAFDVNVSWANRDSGDQGKPDGHVCSP